MDEFCWEEPIHPSIWKAGAASLQATKPTGETPYEVPGIYQDWTTDTRNKPSFEFSDIYSEMQNIGDWLSTLDSSTIVTTENHQADSKKNESECLQEEEPTTLGDDQDETDLRDGAAFGGILEAEWNQHFGGSVDQKQENVNKGGRPQLKIEENKSKVSAIVKGMVRHALKEIEPKKKSKKPRNDIFKTRLVRAANKLPLEIVYSISPRLVRITDYKSPDIRKFAKSFRHAFDIMWRELEEFGLTRGAPTNENFIDFCALHFPESKVLEIAQLFNLGDRAEELLQKRALTSLRSYQEMAKKNSVFRMMVEYIHKICSTQFSRFEKTEAMLSVLLKELSY